MSSMCEQGLGVPPEQRQQPGEQEASGACRSPSCMASSVDLNVQGPPMSHLLVGGGREPQAGWAGPCLHLCETGASH